MEAEPQRLDSGAMRLAWFVTHHGFGHAARTAAILEELARRDRGLEVTFWSEVPEWFWRESLPARLVRLRPCPADLGTIQRTPFEEDPAATLEALETWWSRRVEPFRAEWVEELRKSRSDAVVCDIAPLGLELGRAAGLPTVLVENFTWDWIYEGLEERAPGLGRWIERFRLAFEMAQDRLALEPHCGAAPGAFRIPPVARPVRVPKEAIRERLGVSRGQPLVVVSFGGFPWAPTVTRRDPPAGAGVVVVVGAAERESWQGRWRLLPHRCPVPHPDLIHASDLWVGKPGYSTVVEVARAGSRALLLPRPGFREAEPLAKWLAGSVPVGSLDPEELRSGTWLERVASWLEQPRGVPREAPGASEAARVLYELFA